MRKRQKLDAATPEPGDDPADEVSDDDAPRADDDEPALTSATADDSDTEPDDPGPDDAGDDADQPAKRRNSEFSSPSTIAGAPVDDHTPAWGGRQLAEAIEAERKVAKLKRSTAVANGRTGSAAVLARLEAFDRIGVAAFDVGGSSEGGVDATPDSGVPSAPASRTVTDTTGSDLAPPSTDDRPAILAAEVAERDIVDAGVQTDGAETGESETADSRSDREQTDRADEELADGDINNDEISSARADEPTIAAPDLTAAEETTNSFAAWEASVARDEAAAVGGTSDVASPSSVDRRRPKGWLSNSRELTIVVPAKRGQNGDSSTPARARRPTLPDEQRPSKADGDSFVGPDNRTRPGWTASSGDALAGALVGGAATVPGSGGRVETPGQITRDDTDLRSRHTEVDDPGRNGRTDAGDPSAWHDLERVDEHRTDDYYDDDDDYDPDRDEHPPVHGGHRWFRRQIRNYGPLLGLVPMALFGLLAWAGQQFSSNGSVAGLSIGLGAAAAPFLMIAGLPFGSSESYRIAVVASIVIWLGIGWWASRRALADPMPTWRTFFHQLLWLSLAVGGGVLAAYAIALRALG